MVESSSRQSACFADEVSSPVESSLTDSKDAQHPGRGGEAANCVIVGLLGRVSEPDPERTRERGGTGASRRRFFPAFYGNKPNLDITPPRQNMPSSQILPFHLGDLGLTPSTSVS